MYCHLEDPIEPVDSLLVFLRSSVGGEQGLQGLEGLSRLEGLVGLRILGLRILGLSILGLSLLRVRGLGLASASDSKEVSEPILGMLGGCAFVLFCVTVDASRSPPTLPTPCYWQLSSVTI